ncbi:MAG: LCP family protein [Dehalococcoidia bacterium]|nr:LCP family protein [Dehalococcoidia bacterium]
MQIPWHHSRVARAGWIAVILWLAAGSAYASLASYQRIDGYLFPGNELKIRSVPAFVPGTKIGIDVSLPGVTSEKERAWTRGEQLNILVMGLDRRPWMSLDEPSRSDTMFIATIDKATGRVQMLALPRDLWANVPAGSEPGTWGAAKLNAAYAYGTIYGYPGGGPAAAVAAVEYNYHIDIHQYVVIDWVGFVRLIDAIGGINISVPETVSDFSTDTLDDFEDRTVEAGEHHMNGAQALGYSRVRVDGDLKRIERQQLVIKAVARQALSLGLITRLPELWSSYRDAIVTDVDNGLIPGLALLARDLDLENIESFSLGPALYSGIAEDGALILLPNFDEVYAIIDTFLADPRVRDEAPMITVQYPAGSVGEAERIADHLAAHGVPPQWITVTEGDDHAPGIYNLTGKDYTAGKLAGLLQLRAGGENGEVTTTADILVQIGATVELKAP